MHILMVSKACLVGAYQRKLEEIAAFPDVKLTVIVPPSWDDKAGRVQLEQVHTAGYTLLVDPLRFNGRYHIHYYPQLKARITALQPDILHMDEEPYNLATWLAFRHAAAAKRPLRTLFFSWQNIYNLYPPPFRWLEKKVLAQADYAIVGNQDAETVWRRKGYQGPCRTIPQFGIDPQLFQPINQPERDTFVIGCAGRRLVPEKGLDLLFQAAAKLAGNWQLRIAGEGPDQSRLQRLASRLGIAERVEFIGVIPSTGMAAFLQQLDALVLPSQTTATWKEQFGRVLIEAMACGVPVVGSDSGEIPHVIGAAGLVFPENDVGALGAHLEQLIQSPTLAADLADAGRKRVLAQYTQSQIAAQTVAVYREMMAK